jgi:SHS2 domain-containing protein
MSFKFLDHPADIAVEVSGKSLEELFIESAKAWRKTVVHETKDSQNLILEIKLSSKIPEALLVNFLNEINYFLFTKKWLMNSVEIIKISKDILVWNLAAKITGDDISNSELSINEEIKAITFHQMNIKELNGLYTTRIIFDI